jgi:prepilin-type N-terminal cleavage/methylation domain-containing protein
MKTCKYKTGFTLVEMLVVIAIVAVLATLIAGVASRVETREKEKHCRSTLVLLGTALTQFHDYGFSYDKDSDYAAFGFPLDCNDFSPGELENVLGKALNADVSISGGVHDANDSSNEVMYLLLSMVPTSRETLEKIDRKLIASREATITIDGRVYPLLRVLDPWGTALWYDYYDELPPPLTSTEVDNMEKSAKSFPLVTSAGPDRLFGTDDDITNR